MERTCMVMDLQDKTSTVAHNCEGALLWQALDKPVNRLDSFSSSAQVS